MPNYSAELPWLNVQLNEICSKPQYGYTTKASNIGQIKFLRTTDITKGQLNWDSVPYCESPPDDILKYQLKDRDIVISRAGSIGFSCLLQDVPEPSVFASYLIRFEPSIYISEVYLKRFLESHDYWSQLALMSAGNAVQNVNAQKLSKINLPLPPLAEQKVIAYKLDILLEKVAATKARLERIPEILKTFRQSVLSAATSGKLTKEWREENHFIPSYLDKGKEKFKSDLFDLAMQSLPGLPKEWVVIPMANIIEYVTSGSRGWAEYYANDGALFLRMSNVRYNTTKLDLHDLQYVNLPENVEGKRSLVRKNDLIISITADVGRVARIDMELEEAYVNQHLALVRPSKYINSEYLAICVAAVNIGVKQVQALKRGATKAGLGLDEIRSLAIPFPSIQEQTEIVRRAENLLSFANSIELKAKAALAPVNNLTQSILFKAFRGELTADWRVSNSELISGENSAEALLKKIKAKHESIKRQAKPKYSAIKKKTGGRMSKQIIKVAEALKQAGEALSGQQLLGAAGYPSDSSIEQLEQFFLDIRDALIIEESIVKLERDDDGQDWFDLAKVADNE
ncbi:restriction endonuclease subunit S [Providencia sp. PROV075]|uniref:restriction endonuclease subunit S n=1 Tax=Providencia sp. PROV075 TaxID=2949797 RepID=UPI0023497A58|nr:restriction endonuclease subunit S [Providencia sp. PROV075]